MIGELREKYHFAKRFEFKFRKASDKLRRDFLKQIDQAEFKVSVVSIDKSTGADNISPSNLYNATILESLRKIPDLKNVEIYLDGEAGKSYRRKVKTFLRKNLSSGIIKKFSYVDSRDDNLIQLADMIAGAASYAISKGDDRYLKIVSKHIL